MRYRRWHFWALAAVVAVALAALLFAPVRVSGVSMLPVLEEGDVLVTEPLWMGAPQRYDLVVCEEPDSGTRVVKRVAGLPGEDVQLIDGDLFVNGQRHARDVHGPEDLLPLVQASGPDLDRWFDLTGAGFRSGGPGWELDGSGEASLRQPPRSGYLLHGTSVSNADPAVDLGLEVEYVLLSESARLELSLQESDTRFVLVLEQLGREARLEQRAGSLPPVILAAATLSRPATRGRLFLANVDQRLTATWDGQLLFAPVPYQPPAQIRMEGLPVGLHFEQAALGGQGPLQVLRARLGRDLFFDAAGTHGGSETLQLAEDEYFLIGDNPAQSRDSRWYGPVPSSSLRGRVVGRLWPPGGVGFGW